MANKCCIFDGKVFFGWYFYESVFFYQKIALRLAKSFRFEDEDDYEYEIWFKVFSRILKIQTSRKASFCHFSLENKVSTVILSELGYSAFSRSPNDATSNIWSCFLHHDIRAKTRSRITVSDHVFPPKWRWFTRVCYLVLRKSRTRCRTCLRISRFLIWWKGSFYGVDIPTL